MKNNLLIDLSTLGLIAVSGNDAAKFLQGQLTCDVGEVTATQSRLGAHCDPKGRIQFTFRLLKHQDIYYLRLPQNLISHALSLLQKYVVFFKARLEDVSSLWHSFGCSGPDVQNYFKDLPSAVDEIMPLQDLMIIMAPGPVRRFEIIGKPEALQNFQKRLQENAKLVDFNTWKLLDIQAGIAHITSDTSGEFTPHDINYPALNAVSFNKGCYTGQEIVARMQYLGKLKQHLVRIQFKTTQPPFPGMKLFIENDQEVGRIIETALDEDHYQALAVLQDRALEKAIHLAQDNVSIVHVLSLP